MTGPRLAEAPYRFAAGVLTLTLHVQPGAGATGWAGLHGQALRLRLSAPPREGLANQACIRYLAQAAGVPRSAVSILSGQSARHKVVRIEGVAEARFHALKAEWSA
jgi:uncharacterized protein (TIGR00251 family)